jgi:hypothetical protein
LRINGNFYPAARRDLPPLDDLQSLLRGFFRVLKLGALAE